MVGGMPEEGTISLTGIPSCWQLRTRLAQALPRGVDVQMWLAKRPQNPGSNRSVYLCKCDCYMQLYG